MYNVGDHVTIKQTVWQDRKGNKVEPQLPMTVGLKGVQSGIFGETIWLHKFGVVGESEPLPFNIQTINHEYSVSGYYADTYQSYCGHVTADTIEDAFNQADVIGVVVCSIVQGFVNDLSALSNWPKVD